GASNWSFLKRVKQFAGDRTILGSGDLFSADACVRMIEETGVDGVTIARGCIGNPWIFQECRALYAGQPLPDPPSVEEQGRAIRMHWDLCVESYGEDLAQRVIRKFGIKYSEHHPHAREVRDAFAHAKRADDVRAALDTWFDPERDWPDVQRREGHGDLVAAGATL
ncbi:MAG: tRNA-dihydrouridine synthase, partial [Phycisphaerae bacterium]